VDYASFLPKGSDRRIGIKSQMTIIEVASCFGGVSERDRRIGHALEE